MYKSNTNNKAKRTKTISKLKGNNYLRAILKEINIKQFNNRFKKKHLVIV